MRLEAIGQRRKVLAELERLKELERAGRVLAAREERQAEPEEAEEPEDFREWLRGSARISAFSALPKPVTTPNFC
jgi:hypothetical protein